MSPLPDKLPIVPFTRPVRGSVTLPGSKSITNRALILAALGNGTTLLRGALFSRDSRIMVAALRQLGFKIETDETALTIRVEGRGGEIPVREARLDIGNAGTAARFLTAFVCLHPDGIYHFDGDEAMRRRPIGALLQALESQGAKASARSFPFTLKTAGLPGGVIEIDASESSQLLSALIMAAPRARSPFAITLLGKPGSLPFIRMTEEMVEQFRAGPTSYDIEGDASAGSYFLALPLVTGGSLSFTNYGGTLQGDVKFREVVTAAGPARHAVTQNFREFSDTFLTLAAIAPLFDGPTKISGIAHTRKQETDRVAGMARELIKLGQHVIETEDSLEIHPRPLKSGVVIETYHDHRFAMSFGVLGCHDLHGNGQPWLTINDPACCSKTFPHFFDVLASLRSESLNNHMAPSSFTLIAIDGGAASGKSSTSRALAERFNLLHVDTGSFYRHITSELLRRNVSHTDHAAIKAVLPKLEFSTRLAGRSAQMLLGGQPAGDEIRDKRVNENVAHFAAVPEVREVLIGYQRDQVEVGRQHGFRGLVMEGRDIGSKIFPDADFRFFLFADPVERAKRRAAEGRQDAIGQRDTLDSQRLNQSAEGAIAIDSTHLTLEQVVDKMAALIAPKLD